MHTWMSKRKTKDNKFLDKQKNKKLKQLNKKVETNIKLYIYIYIIINILTQSKIIHM